jgi:twitching motility protein PilT
VVDVFPPEQVSQIRAMVSESLRGVVSQQLLPRTDGHGRVAALEILVCTAAIANLIRENRTFQIPSLMQIGIKQGMRLMDVSLAELVHKGEVTADEAILHVEDQVEFLKVLAKTAPADAEVPGVDDGAEEDEDG